MTIDGKTVILPDGVLNSEFKIISTTSYYDGKDPLKE